MVHYRLKAFLEEHPDLSAISHFNFFNAYLDFTETDACSIWLKGLMELAKAAAPVTKASIASLQEKYLTDKHNGKLRQYWDDRKLVQENEKTDRAAAIQTSISINRATTRVLQSADKQVENRLENADKSKLQGLRAYTTPVTSDSTTSDSTAAGRSSKQDGQNKESLPFRRKRPREQSEVDDILQSRTPEYRKSPSPTPIFTESVDSLFARFTGRRQKNPFLDSEDDDEEEEETCNEDSEEYSTLLPDSTELDFHFEGSLDGINIADGFKSLFSAVKRKKVKIMDTDQALARSGVILLEMVGTDFQNEHFGDARIIAIREKALKKWQKPESSTVRNEVRAWLDDLEDNSYDRAKSLDHLYQNRPSNPKRQGLWTFVMSALQNFPECDTSKVYSESTGISSFILPLCRVFMANPSKLLFLNFVDVTTVTGRSRNGSNSRKEPDLALEIKDRSNKTILEVGIGEVTSHAEKNCKKKNAKDLVRIGLSLKDALDHAQDVYGIDSAVLPGWQVIGNTMAIYFMFKCGNMYLFVHAKNVTIPDSLTELKDLGAGIKTWLELQATVEHGLRPVLDGIAAGRKPTTNAGSLRRIATTRTPEFKSFLKK